MARPRQVTDDEILEAVRRCVFEHGPAVSTVCIAESIGVSQATLFKRFGDKTNLMLKALLPDARPDFLELVEKGPRSSRTIRKELEEIGVATVAHFREVMPRIMALRQAGLDPRVLLGAFDVPPPVLFLQSLQRWFERAKNEGWLECRDSEATAMAFIGSLHVRVFFDIMIGPSADGSWQKVGGTDRDHVENLVHNLWCGFAPEGSSL